jgi:peptidyl-prolyl cis-trans isomerase SurA
MKKVLLGLVLVFPLWVNAAEQTKAEQEVDLDRVAAIVNDEVITESTLDKFMEQTYAQMMRMHSKLPSETAFRKNVLNQLINKTLQLQITKRSHINVTDQEVDSAIEHVMAQNHMSEKEFQEEIDHQGLSKDQFKAQIRESLVIQKLQESAVRNKVTITEKEIDDYLKSQEKENATRQEYHLSRILIPLPEEPTTQQLQATKVRAEGIYRQLKNGADFTKTATENSSSDSLEGGGLGWKKFAELPSIFTESVKQMKVNDIVGPIQAPNGFHIIKLVETRSGDNQLSRDKVRNMMYQRKMAEKVQEWLNQIRSTSYIKII